jgi:hypothetical protein
MRYFSRGILPVRFAACCWVAANLILIAFIVVASCLQAFVIAILFTNAENNQKFMTILQVFWWVQIAVSVCVIVSQCCVYFSYFNHTEAGGSRRKESFIFIVISLFFESVHVCVGLILFANLGSDQQLIMALLVFWCVQNVVLAILLLYCGYICYVCFCYVPDTDGEQPQQNTDAINLVEIQMDGEQPQQNATVINPVAIQVDGEQPPQNTDIINSVAIQVDEEQPPQNTDIIDPVAIQVDEEQPPQNADIIDPVAIQVDGGQLPQNADIIDPVAIEMGDAC